MTEADRQLIGIMIMLDFVWKLVTGLVICKIHNVLEDIRANVRKE